MKCTGMWLIWRDEQMSCGVRARLRDDACVPSFVPEPRALMAGQADARRAPSPVGRAQRLTLTVYALAEICASSRRPSANNLRHSSSLVVFRLQVLCRERSAAARCDPQKRLRDAAVPREACCTVPLDGSSSRCETATVSSFYVLGLALVLQDILPDSRNA